MESIFKIEFRRDFIQGGDLQKISRGSPSSRLGGIRTTPGCGIQPLQGWKRGEFMERAQGLRGVRGGARGGDSSV